MHGACSTQCVPQRTRPLCAGRGAVRRTSRGECTRDRGGGGAHAFLPARRRIPPHTRRRTLPDPLPVVSAAGPAGSSTAAAAVAWRQRLLLLPRRAPHGEGVALLSELPVPAAAMPGIEVEFDNPIHAAPPQGNVGVGRGTFDTDGGASDSSTHGGSRGSPKRKQKASKHHHFPHLHLHLGQHGSHLLESLGLKKHHLHEQKDPRTSVANDTFERLFKMVDYNRDHSLREGELYIGLQVRSAYSLSGQTLQLQLVPCARR